MCAEEERGFVKVCDSAHHFLALAPCASLYTSYRCDRLILSMWSALYYLLYDRSSVGYSLSNVISVLVIIREQYNAKFGDNPNLDYTAALNCWTRHNFRHPTKTLL